VRDSFLRLTRVLLFTSLALASGALTAPAQVQTIGLFQYDSSASPGYNLFSPGAYETTFLVDMWGRLINQWSTAYQPSFSAYLLENGDLLRTGKMTAGGGAGGRIQKFDWHGTLIWDYVYFTSDVLQHHDIEPLPNGNVLILAWEDKTQAEALAAGRDPAMLPPDELSPEHVVEVEPTGFSTGNIVWEWHLWDHLVQDYDSNVANYGVVEDHPELVDINYAPGFAKDWIHANSVDYNPELDQIIINSLVFDEFWIIDHSTTTAEAAGHTGGNSGMGGDILYRWGNPQTYRAGDESDRMFFNQHDARWVPSGVPGEGHVMVFNNGLNRPPGVNYSSVDEIVTTVDINGQYPQPSSGQPHAPSDLEWTYGATPPTDWYATNFSGSQRLPNGNTLICSGPEGIFFEVTADSQIVWQYINPVDGGGINSQGDLPGTNRAFRCTRYPANYPGLAGRDLTPGSAIEIYPITISGTSHTPEAPTPLDSVIVTATITSSNPITIAAVYADFGAGFTAWTMHDDGNHHDGAASDGLYGSALPPVAGETTIPYYVHAEDDQSSSVNDPPNPPSTVYWFSVCCPVPHIFINEFMAVNTACCQDEHGDFDSWIELYNYEEFDVDLTGMYLTNILDDSTLFPIGDLIIPAKGHLLFWTDNETGEGPTHTSFILNPSGGEIGLYSTDDLRRILIDSVTYTAQAADHSYGRAADGSPLWTDFITPTPGSANSSCACPNQGDAEPDGFVTALDLASCIDILFAGAIDLQDPGCPSPRFDFDCDGFSTALDLAVLIDHLFAGGGGPCGPCSP
jgi:hypothetical protein